MKQVTPLERSKRKRSLSLLEAQNMSVGCSSDMIQAGTRSGWEKWLPMSARDALEFVFTP
eukprot:4291370-Amphidinium_carterae.1